MRGYDRDLINTNDGVQDTIVVRETSAIDDDCVSLKTWCLVSFWPRRYRQHGPYAPGRIFPFSVPRAGTQPGARSNREQTPLGTRGEWYSSFCSWCLPAPPGGVRLSSVWFPDLRIPDEMRYFLFRHSAGRGGVADLAPGKPSYIGRGAGQPHATYTDERDDSGAGYTPRHGPRKGKELLDKAHGLMGALPCLSLRGTHKGGRNDSKEKFPTAGIGTCQPLH
jgi:hypothetical protein